MTSDGDETNEQDQDHVGPTAHGTDTGTVSIVGTTEGPASEPSSTHHSQILSNSGSLSDIFFEAAKDFRTESEIKRHYLHWEHRSRATLASLVDLARVVAHSLNLRWRIARGLMP